MTLKNSKGTIFYGMHMYPGVAEYKELDNLRVLVGETCIRQMGPSFAGRPVFVFHKDEIATDIDVLRTEADGWVIDSFFNEADGKHWAKFIICSEKGMNAIRSGYRLSNCYTPKQFDKGGECNGVPYDKEVTEGEYDHLAIVPNPRYEDSVVMTPDEYKDYNEAQKFELLKLANAGGTEMKLNLFKKAKLENSADIENIVVVLPKSGREIAITALCNEADDAAVAAAKKEPKMANDDDYVNVGDKKMSVKELCNEYLKMGDDSKHEAVDVDEHDLKNDDMTDADLIVADPVAMNSDDSDADDDDDVENADDDDAARIDEPKDKEIDAAKKKKNAKEKADKLRNAQARGNREDYAQEPSAFDPTARVARGIARYGS